MPRPVDSTATYRPGLDGVRALAVVAVLGYHFAVPGMGGGLLGVGIFFTLSGFLITSILLSTWERTGQLALKRFWLRRARRLLPALVVVLVVVLAATAIVDQTLLDTRVRESLAGTLYVSNWTTIAGDLSYFERFGGPGPLDHLWSLAVEEQFYLVWPVVLMFMLNWRRLTNRQLIRWTLILAAVSFLLLALFAAPGFDNTRTYEGTDTRAGELLIGAAFAMITRPWIPRVSMPAAGRVVSDLAGVGALAVLVWMIVNTSEYSMGLYRGGLLVSGLATAILVSVVSLPESMLGRALGIAPLRWVGERSYGIYLWHLPLVAFMPLFVRDVPWLGTVLLVALTFGIAALSWEHIENPIRTHGFRGAWKQRRTERPTYTHDGQPKQPARFGMPQLVTGTAAVATFGVVALSITGVLASEDAAEVPSASIVSQPGEDAVIQTHETFPAKGSGDGAGAGAGQGKSGQHRKAVKAKPGDTSCQRVVHIGDSTSIGLMSPSYLPDKSDRIAAQYRRVGASDVETDIAGARSIVEEYKGEPNAYDATKERVDDGYDGCWVFAMGTNDTANQFVGGVVPLKDRIERLMKEIDGQPALWVSVKSRLSSGPWADAQMQKWNAALHEVSERYPNMRIYDWRRQVQNDWFISDGIHFTSAGYKQRAKRIADALAVAFPAGSDPSSGMVVVPN